jgi:hypothetical protein
MDKVALGQFLPSRFFPCQFLSLQIIHAYLSSGAGAIGRLVADVPNGLSVTPPHDIKEKYLILEKAGGRRMVLFFSEDRSNMFLRNVGPFLLENMASNPTR